MSKKMKIFAKVFYIIALCLSIANLLFAAAQQVGFINLQSADSSSLYYLLFAFVGCIYLLSLPFVSLTMFLKKFPKIYWVVPIMTMAFYGLVLISIIIIVATKIDQALYKNVLLFLGPAFDVFVLLFSFYILKKLGKKDVKAD